MKRIVVRSIIALTANLALIASALADTPATPQNVQGAWITESGAPLYARVSWDLSAGATGYNVFRYNPTNEQWDLIAPAVSGNFFRDLAVSEFPAYYTVSAVGPDGESAGSPSVTAEAGDPGGFTLMRPEWYPGRLTPTNAFIVWISAWITGSDGMLEIGDSLTNMSLVLFDTFYAGGHGLHVTNLEPATVYYYRITAVGTNRAGLAEVFSFETPNTNRPPVAANVTVGQNSIYPTDLLLSCTDPDPQIDYFTFRVVTVPTNGTLSASTVTSWDPYIHIDYIPNSGARGEDHFQYVVSDGQLDSAPATVTISNIFLNRDPVVTSVVTNTPEDTSLSLVLTATDPDGDPVSIAVSGAQYGTVSFDGTNLVYTPYPDYNGEDVIYIYAADPYSGYGFGTIEISVLPVDDAPVAYPVEVPTYEDVSLSLVYLWGTDLEGDPLTFHVIDGPSHGTVTGTWPNMIYTPATNYFGPDSFTYVADDGQKISAPATATIEVWPINDFPVATPVSVTLAEDGTTNIVLSGTDVEGDALIFSVQDGPLHGTLSGDAPNLVYTPDANYFGDDSFTFVAFDDSSVSELATVSITITPVNDAPVATPIFATVAEDTSANIVLAGTDVDGDGLTFTLVSNPAHGTLSGTVPNLTYTPAANYFGNDSFAFKVSDGQVASALATVSLTVTSVNDVPVATPASVTLVEDTSANIALSGSDVEGDTLTFTIASNPAHGTLSGTAPNLVYTPAANYFGVDSFTFTTSDSQATSGPATVTITVTPVNDAPAATPKSVTLAEDTSTNIVLTGTDVEGDALTFTVTVNPAHGTLSGTAPNLTYTPAANYFGSDNFAFKVTDGQVDSAVAIVTLTVTSVNDVPVATPASVTLAEDTSTNIVLTGSDVEGDALTFTVASNPAHGTLSGTAPNLVYTPAANYFGSDSFTFRASDGQATSGPATVTITVTPVNDAPAAQAQSISTPYNTPVAITLAGTDVEGSALSYVVLTQPANGALSGTAPNLTFTPNIGFSGGSSFTFKVNDGSLDSASAMVTITVQAATAVPAAPSALTATAVSSSQINLAWTDNSNNEDGFKIERSTNGSTWTQIATVGPNAQSYPSTGLSANKTYFYRVRAYNMLGNSAYSNTASAKTLH